jgi:Tat protein secretion system quality control protein TatD with DNase activity
LKPDGGTFRFAFVNPTTLKKSASEEMNTNMSASQMHYAVKEYYNSVGVHPWIIKKNYDAEDKETTDAELIVKTVFEISIDRLINGVSALSVTALRATSKSEITFEHNVVVSGAPLSGKYKILCVNE